ncbi:bacteriocin immunity protein [Yersinia pestis]|uniref:bacteriocin immunity protein n=1 Tax=Yersinia pestis TaxID=632 RepID=UPI003990D1A3
MELKEKYEDYTEHEFLEFIRNICEVNTDSQSLHSSWVRNFTKITEHPSGSDLIYYPEDGADDSPEGILELVKKWRAENGKPGFKK